MTRAAAAIGILALALSGCRNDNDGDGAGSSIDLGSLLTSTGALAGIGSDMLRAVDLAVTEVNDAGGLLGGKMVTLVNQDDGTDEGLAGAAAQAHVDNGITAFVGAVGSGFSLAAADIATPTGVVMISPSSTSPTLSEYADDGYFFRTCPSDALQATLMAQRALASGVTTAAIVHVPGAYGEGMADFFESTFTGGGGTITSKVEYVEGQTDYIQLWNGIFADNPEVVAMPVYPTDGAQMMNDYLGSFATQGATFYFADALANDDFVDLVGAANFTFEHEGTAPSFAGPEAAHFDGVYSDAHGDSPGAFLGNAYDAAMLIMLAIEAGGGDDGASIRDNLQAVSAGGTAYGAKDLADLIAAAGAGEDVNYEGASSSVDFEDNGDIIAPYDIWKVGTNGVQVTEEGVAPSR